MIDLKDATLRDLLAEVNARETPFRRLKRIVLCEDAYYICDVCERTSDKPFSLIAIFNHNNESIRFCFECLEVCNDRVNIFHDFCAKEGN